jgi:hypothetical protein
MRRHLRVEHSWQSPQGKGRQSVAARLAETAYHNVITSPVYCETFYQQSEFVRFFQVPPPSPSATAAAPATAVAVAVNMLQEGDLARQVGEPLTSLYEIVTLRLDQMLQVCVRAHRQRA